MSILRVGVHRAIKTCVLTLHPCLALSITRSKTDTDVRKVASWQVEENMTEEILDKKINELVASRGRKNTDPREVLRKLEVLSKSARPLGK